MFVEWDKNYLHIADQILLQKKSKFSWQTFNLNESSEVFSVENTLVFKVDSTNQFYCKYVM